MEDGHVPGQVLLELRQRCADQLLEPRPSTGSLRFWDERSTTGQDAATVGLVAVDRGTWRYYWEVRIPGNRRTPAVVRTGKALTCRGAWAKAGAALPQLTPAQWEEVAADRRAGADRCRITGEVPLLAADESGAAHTRVFVCSREAGHGGTNHAGPLLHAGGPEEDGLSAEWPREPEAPPPALAEDTRYARLAHARGPYRVGRKVPHHVYRQLGDYPDDDDVSLFDAVRGDLAAEVVEALNTRRITLEQTGQADEPLGTVRLVPLHTRPRRDYDALERTATEAMEAEMRRGHALTTEITRLGEALKVCEEALHRTEIVRDGEIVDDEADALLHAAQQASGAYTDRGWRPGRQARDDADTTGDTDEEHRRPAR